MKINSEILLDFDDVLIEPKRSEAATRNIPLDKHFRFKYAFETMDVVPIIAANMDTTGTIAMAETFKSFNALVALHKFYSLDQLTEYREQGKMSNAFFTIGIQPTNFDKLRAFSERFDTSPPLICVDVANGYTQHFVDFVRSVRNLCPSSVIMAGNVATPEMTQELIINGKVDIVKIGIGPGSVCTTRLKTGVGYPQLSAIAQCSDVAHGLKAHICADGGCKTPGDVSKAFGAGADFVMVGGMLAGTDECEGKWEYEYFSGERYLYLADNSIKSTDGSHGRWPEGFKPSSYANDYYQSVVTHNIQLDNKIIKEPTKKALAFHGMSSEEAMELHNGGMSDYKTAEGVEITVPYKGPAQKVLKDILGGIRSTCAYIGASNIKDLPKCCTFIRVNRIKEYLYNV